MSIEFIMFDENMEYSHKAIFFLERKKIVEESHF